MELLETEITEYTTPKINRQIMCWDPITVKIKQTDETSRIIGRQLKKQIEVYEGDNNPLDYKFEMNLDEWLLEGCWLQNVDYFTYGKDSYTELKVRFDNATEK